MNITFTEKEVEMGRELYEKDKAALALYAELIQLLKWDVSVNAKLVRTTLGNFRDCVGQSNPAYKYCSDIYNADYCACGIKNCSERKEHIIDVPSRYCSDSYGYGFCE